jgi:hypothetical protein
VWHRAEAPQVQVPPVALLVQLLLLHLVE